jgi:hypothetical protein
VNSGCLSDFDLTSETAGSRARVRPSAYPVACLEVEVKLRLVEDIGSAGVPASVNLKV